MKNSKDNWLDLREAEVLKDLEEHQRRRDCYIIGCDLYDKDLNKNGMLWTEIKKQNY